VSLGVLILTFRLWPVEERAVERPAVVEAKERVPIELIEPTRQQPRAAPPPPPALPPVEVPDDVPIPDVELEFEVLETAPSLDLALPDLPPGPANDSPAEAPPTFVARADRKPQTMGFTPPAIPREAERRGIRARVRVRVRIDARGRLQEVEITDRFLIDGRDREERVDEIGYGVEQAVLDAVNRTRFRPGRHEGRAVETYTTMTVSVGV
jgi:protein TonB